MLWWWYRDGEGDEVGGHTFKSLKKTVFLAQSTCENRFWSSTLHINSKRSTSTWLYVCFCSRANSCVCHSRSSIDCTNSRIIGETLYRESEIGGRRSKRRRTIIISINFSSTVRAPHSSSPAPYTLSLNLTLFLSLALSQSQLTSVARWAHRLCSMDVCQNRSFNCENKRERE